jgi:hypothetical protein
MDYLKNYLQYIKYVKTLDRRKGSDEYYEKHHIFPRSIYPLWKDKASNIVLLTAREHFLAHYLLCKIYEHRNKRNYFKMLNAFEALSILKNQKTREVIYCNSKLYEKMKTEISKKTSALMKGNSFNKGRIQSKKEIEKRRLSNTGKKRTQEQIENIKKGIGINYMVGINKMLEKTKKRIRCVESDTTYESSCEASRKLHISQGNISMCANGKRMTAGGFHFEYIGDC